MNLSVSSLEWFNKVAYLSYDLSNLWLIDKWWSILPKKDLQSAQNLGIITSSFTNFVTHLKYLVQKDTCLLDFPSVHLCLFLSMCHLSSCSCTLQLSTGHLIKILCCPFFVNIILTLLVSPKISVSFEIIVFLLRNCWLQSPFF